MVPIIYFKILITFGLGITLGYIIKFMVRITHNRNQKSKITQALIFGILANYFQWTAYILFAYNGKAPNLTEFLLNLHWLIHPRVFIDAISEINKVGMWSIFGVVVNGFGLTFIWIMEALIIIAIPIVAIIKTKIYPYSELLNRWFPKYTLFKDFGSIAAVNAITKELQSDPIKTINSLGKGTGIRHSKAHLFYHKDEKVAYLTFEEIFIEDAGKGKKKKDIIINNFTINKGTAENILSQFDHKKERSDIF